MSGFTTMIASDDDHDKIFAEIYFAEKFVALVSQEDGIDQLKVEFPGSDLDENMILREISMDGFLNALNKARNRLVGEIP